MKLIPTVRIWRIEEGDEGTFGVMTICGQAFCVTLELPDRFNQEDISCIPSGQYLCKRKTSPHFGEVFELADVPGRDHIYFHVGNIIDDTTGCILLARQFGKLGGNRAIRNSGTVLVKFMKTFDGIDEFTLIIREAY